MNHHFHGDLDRSHWEPVPGGALTYLYPLATSAIVSRSECGVKAGQNHLLFLTTSPRCSEISVIDTTAPFSGLHRLSSRHGFQIF